MDEYDLQQKCIYWQKQLHLQDWDITPRIERRHNMDVDNVTGTCTYNLNAKKARIQILDPIDYNEDEFSKDLEQTLVHELLHLHFSGWTLISENSECPWHAEQGIDAIAQALVNINRDKKEI